MKDDIFELYISGVETISIVVAVLIVLLTSPVWSFLYLAVNTGKIIDSVEDKIKRRKNNE